MSNLGRLNDVLPALLFANMSMLRNNVYFYKRPRDQMFDRWKCEGGLGGHPPQSEVGPCPVSMSPLPPTISGKNSTTLHHITLNPPPLQTPSEKLKKTDPYKNFT